MIRKSRKKSKSSALHSTMALLRARLVRDEQGATAIEYALIAAGISVAIAAAVTNLGSATKALYTSVAAIFS